MASIPKLNLLSGFGGGNFSLGTGSKLLQKRSWLVIVGDEAPVGEVNNANAIATFLRRKFNLVPLRGSWKPEYANNRKVAAFPNILVIGGPIANEWAFKLNDVVEPKFDITVLREKTADETWAQYVQSGGLQTSGFIVNGVKVAGAVKFGVIGAGSQKSMGVRSSQVVFVTGWAYEDTCVMAKAFMENAVAGLYDVQYTTTVPNMDVNPEGMAYTKRP